MGFVCDCLCVSVCGFVGLWVGFRGVFVCFKVRKVCGLYCL